jgi:4-amino-4-deoxy-L-arabinose transferase-like glycosyltransferase
MRKSLHALRVPGQRYGNVGPQCLPISLGLCALRTVAAIAVSILVVFSPNLIAHGTLSNNDGYFALGVVASLLFFRQYLLRPTLENACLSGSTLALAQLTKSFALYLYAVVAVFLLLVSNDRKNGPPLLSRKDLIGFVSLGFASFILVMNAGFCFRIGRSLH